MLIYDKLTPSNRKSRLAVDNIYIVNTDNPAMSIIKLSISTLSFGKQKLFWKPVFVISDNYLQRQKKLYTEFLFFGGSSTIQKISRCNLSEKVKSSLSSV